MNFNSLRESVVYSILLFPWSKAWQAHLRPVETIRETQYPMWEEIGVLVSMFEDNNSMLIRVKLESYEF